MDNLQNCDSYVNIPSSQTYKTPWAVSTSELYRPSDRRLSAKLVRTFTDRWCRVVTAADLYGRVLGFLDWDNCTTLRKYKSVGELVSVARAAVLCPYRH
jgi:hypothetical protein